MKLIVPISGGKDSQATLLYCIEKYGVENLHGVFCDTKWEHELTYTHLDYLVEISGVKFSILSSKKYKNFVDLCEKKKRFPSSQVGFCTVELKVIPMIDFILDIKDHVIIFQGIRRDESKKRSTAEEQCRYFKYYFEPYKSNKITIHNLFPVRNTLSKDRFKKLTKAILRLKQGKLDETYFTYRKKDVFEWCSKYADDVHRPFIDASAQDVLNYSFDRGYDINPLYFFEGITRVGCFPCKNARKDEMKVIIENFPETIIKIRNAEKRVNGTFFNPDYIPMRYHTGFDPKSGKTICGIDDVIRYLKDKYAQISLLDQLEPTETKCNSVLQICE